MPKPSRLDLTSSLESLAVILDNASQALPPVDRDRLKAMVMERLQGAPVIGPGLVHRVVAEAQRELRRLVV
jgi:hypothetical protein